MKTFTFTSIIAVASALKVKQDDMTEGPSGEMMTEGPPGVCWKFFKTRMDMDGDGWTSPEDAAMFCSMASGGEELQPNPDWEYDTQWFADHTKKAFDFQGEEGLDEMEFLNLIYNVSYEILDPEYLNQQGTEQFMRTAYEWYADTPEGVSQDQMLSVWEDMKWGNGWFEQLQYACPGVCPPIDGGDGPADGAIWNSLKMGSGMDMDFDGHVTPDEAAAWVTQLTGVYADPTDHWEDCTMWLTDHLSNHWDENHDGGLDREEFYDLVMTLTDGNALDEHIDQLFDLYHNHELGLMDIGSQDDLWRDLKQGEGWFNQFEGGEGPERDPCDILHDMQNAAHWMLDLANEGMDMAGCHDCQPCGEGDCACY